MENLPLKLRHQPLDRRLGVAEEHPGVVDKEERIVDAGKTRIEGPLQHDYGTALSTLITGMP